MTFEETRLKGAYLIGIEPLEDERGFFARTFCQEEFKKYGLNPKITQCNISYNRARGTLRGMHYQAPPYSEAKSVRCMRGSIYDVIIDLRADSATYLQWIGIELSAAAFSMLYIPEGFAHGFQTREDHTEVFYQMSTFYDPSSARGLRWNDPYFGITWPENTRVISEKDQSYPDFAG